MRLNQPTQPVSGVPLCSHLSACMLGISQTTKDGEILAHPSREDFAARYRDDGSFHDPSVVSEQKDEQGLQKVVPEQSGDDLRGDKPPDAEETHRV
jgi:hypothetical protein